jgi:hypothetical protein
LGIEVAFVGRFDETPGLRRSHPQQMTFSQDKNTIAAWAPRASLVIPPQVSALHFKAQPFHFKIWSFHFKIQSLHFNIESFQLNIQ